ncbi:N-formylglutamate amidohydrolase [Halocynthiibacter sp.]|uniref:N-formylglutamate amidohydrolase n=1 Tax=Halocynthiibacter sp. TaxID=1979210 RepID=UPI003C5EE0E6
MLNEHTIGEVVRISNAEGAGNVVVICEHASARIPDVLNGLGLSHANRQAHAVWDPGALVVAEHIARTLDAPLISAGVSRLVYDLNRPPDASGAMPATSELIDVPGNEDLTQGDRDLRTQLVYDPFCMAVHELLDQRKERGQATAIITMHSFTPVYYGEGRPTEIGILHDKDTRLADAMLAQPTPRRTDRNMPYGPEDGVTHSLQIYGIDRGLPNVMIEVRNDLLGSDADCITLAEELLAMLRPALNQLNFSEGQT